MNTPADEMAGKFGVDKPKHTAVEVFDEECGEYHNPVPETKQPHAPSHGTKQPFGGER